TADNNSPTLYRLESIMKRFLLTVLLLFAGAASAKSGETQTLTTEQPFADVARTISTQMELCYEKTILGVFYPVTSDINENDQVAQVLFQQNGAFGKKRLTIFQINIDHGTITLTKDRGFPNINTL